MCLCAQKKVNWLRGGSLPGFHPAIRVYLSSKMEENWLSAESVTLDKIIAYVLVVTPSGLTAVWGYVMDKLGGEQQIIFWSL